METWRKSNTGLSAVTWVLPAVLVLMVSSVLTAFLYEEYQRGKASVVGQGATPKIEVLELRLTQLDAKAKELRDLLGLLLLVGGFYTALQGLFNFYSAQNFSRQAEGELSRIKELVGNLESQFPMFAEIEKKRRIALDELSTALPSDWRNQGYSSLALNKRQRIFSLESFIALEFLNIPERKEEIGRHLYNLGRFYLSKYTNTRNSFDVDRAEYYLNLALEEIRPKFKALNELSLIYCFAREKEDESPEQKERRLLTAKDFCDRSLALFPEQQRALYNLGNIAHELRDFDLAIERLRSARNKTNWEDEPDGEMKCHILYNLACACCRSAQESYRTDPQDSKVPDLLAEACECLEESAEIGSLEERGFIAKDLEPLPAGKPGDLHFLTEFDESRARVEKALQTFERRWLQREAGNGYQAQTKPRRKMFRAFKAFWDELR